tara:strand:- start:56 stop:1357 length:1302 start_codon:yes stop_codon:yes gene_type:complete
MANTKVTSRVLADDAVLTANITDANVTTAKIAADAITGAKIADDAINSEHYTDGSIDTAHIADDQVTLAKMAGLARGKIIYGDASGNPAALALGSNGQILKSDGTDISWGAESTFDTDAAQVFNESGAAVDFRIEGDTEQNLFFVDGSADKIGIGTSSPDASLHITSNTPIIAFDESDASQVYRIGSFGGSFALYDSTDSAYRITVNGDGNIGIGLTAPTFATGNGMHFADSFYVGLGTGNGTRPDFSLSGNNSGLAIACGTGSDDADILISTAGVMAVPNGIELGSGTDFTSANTLNDYEEGTWTPTVGGNTGQGSTSSGSVAGKYIKIGKLVFASFSIVNITIASASGHLKIGGFPFNNDGTNDREANGVMRVYGVNLEALGSNTSPIPAVNNDTNTAFVLQSKDDAAWSVVQVSNGSGQYFEGSITYITT